MRLNIYNLLVPILLVTLAGISSICLPLKSDSKLNMALTIVLTFIFLQTLVASMIPKIKDAPKVCESILLCLALVHIELHILTYVQVSIYIFWSLLLAVFHVCACVIEWRLITMSSSSKPGYLMDMLCVRCMRRTFWLQLLHRFLRRHPSSRAISPQPETFVTEGIVWYRTKAATAEMSHEDQRTATDSEKTNTTSEQETIASTKLKDEAKVLSSWEEVAHGLNLHVSAIYLFANALIFAIYMCPLLLLILEHSFVTNYVIDYRY